MIRKLGKRAGLENVRCSPHIFRYTFGTSALLNGGGEFEVQSLLGHSTLSMTRRYVATLASESAVVGHRKWGPVDNMQNRKRMAPVSKSLSIKGRCPLLLIPL